MPQSNLRVELTADATKLERGFKSAEASARIMQRELEKVERAERSLGVMQLQAEREMAASFARRRQTALGLSETMGRAAVIGGAVLAGGLALSARAAMQWESAFAGVRKVVDGSPEEMAALERQLRDLATTMPATATEIAGVAEAAGQLGVARQDIAKFTETAIRLGVSTNLSAEDAATGLAKLGNVMGVTNAQVDRAGATLVALGNAGASTEQDILEMAQRIAGAGRTVGITEAQVLGFANALSSVGIEAEAGGTAISRVFLTIDGAVRSGGQALDRFAQVSGVSAQQFAARWKTDAAGATAQFVQGLHKVQESGGNVAGTLDKLGLSEIRVRDTLLRTSNASDLLTQSLSDSTKAWDANNALLNESNRRFETAESRIQTARNQLNDAAIDIGGAVLPAFAGLARDVGTAAKMFTELPGPVKEAAAWIGTIAAGVGILGGAAAVAVPKVIALKTALGEMGPLGQRASAGMGRLGSALTGPVGIGITAGLTVATAALGAWAKKHIEARQRVEDLTAAIKQDSGAVGENTKQTIFNALQKDGVIESAKKMKVDLNDLTNAAMGNAFAQQAVAEQMAAFVQATQAAHGNARGYITDQVKISDAIGGTNDEIRAAVEAYRDQNAALADTTSGAGDAATAAKDAGRGLQDLGQGAQWAAQQLSDLVKAFDDAAGIELDAREAARQYQQAIDDVNDAVKGASKTQRQHKDSLDITTEAGRKNQETLDRLAKAAQQQADAVAKSTGSEAEFRKSLQESKARLEEAAVRFGMTRDKAKEYADSVLAIPDVARTDIQITGLEAARAKIAGLSRSLQGNSALIAAISQGLGGLPRREHGGQVRAGQAYIVGEKRPEIFVPQQDGTIVPQVGARIAVGASSSGGRQVTYQVYAPTTSASDLVATAQKSERRLGTVMAR